MSAEFIQQALLAVLAILYGGILYEIRQLRKAKHAQAQHVQYALLCISLIAAELKIPLPPFTRDGD